MENEFLPEGYKVPETSGYMKLKDGRNKFRVLSSAIIGYEYWNESNKPVRSKKAFDHIPTDIRLDKDGNPTKIKHFWAFVVWNYESKLVQILEITQSTIQSAIKAIVDDEVWGSPKNFDITITRKGEGFDTEYSTMPNPHSDIEPEIQTAYEAKVINLEALYENKNPFGDGK